jgi:hypothetical protein
MRQALAFKVTSYAKHPVQVKQALHVMNPYYGIKPQYQRAEVPPGGDCETVGDFIEQTPGQLDLAPVGSGRVGTNSIRLTQTAFVTDAAVFLEFPDAIDLRWARYVGMWYRTGVSDTWDPGDIAFYIFTRPTTVDALGAQIPFNALYAQRAMAIDFFEAQYVDAGGQPYRYMEFDLTKFTRAAGFESENLSEVWGIGWFSEAGTIANLLEIDQIEFYTHGTGYGPARGNIVSIPLTDGVHARKGYAMAWDETAGRTDLADDNEPAFAGICVDNPSQTQLAVDVVISAVPTTIVVLDASLFNIGTCQIWDDAPNSEVLTITAVNRITNELTVAATVAAYTIANNARLAMNGDEVGSVRVDVMKDGVLNMLCMDGSIGAIGEGVSMAAGAGAAPDIDDGGGASQAVMIGKSLDVGATDEVIPILLGMPGTSA